MGFNGYMDHTQTATVYQVLYPGDGSSTPSPHCLGPHVLDSLYLPCRVERG